MFPFRYRSIFANRYMALFWAAGIIWTAYDFTGGASGDSSGNNQQVATDITGAPVTQQDIDSLKSTLNQL
ncbi:MAG: hypothetical protein JWP15_3509 [Alphaproteobacteria bacterium]|nr:hypothetical protein [Alphaproteobacteria bacterium]